MTEAHVHEYDIALPSVDGWRYHGCECGATECVGRYGKAERERMEFSRRVERVKHMGRENPCGVATWNAVRVLLDDLMAALHPNRWRMADHGSTSDGTTTGHQPDVLPQGMTFSAAELYAAYVCGATDGRDYQPSSTDLSRAADGYVKLAHLRRMEER